MSTYDPAAPASRTADSDPLADSKVWDSPAASPNEPDGGSAGAVDKAKEGVVEVASTAQDAAKDAVQEASTQARAVVSEVSTQARDLYGTTRQELTEQARGKTDQVAQGLRQLSDRATALAEGRPWDAGPLPSYLKEAEGRISQLAGRLEAQGPAGLVDDVARFARRRPLVFIGACAGAGFLLTRFVRSGAASGASGTSNGPAGNSRALTPSAPAAVSSTGAPVTVGLGPIEGA